MYTVARVYHPEPIRKFAIEFTTMLKEPCDPDYYIERWRKMLESGVGIVWALVHDGEVVGGIGGLVAPDLLSGRDTLVELFWYVTPEHRSRGILLFKTMEAYVSERHMRWAMIHMEASMPAKLKAFYMKHGFRLLETHWIKET